VEKQNKKKGERREKRVKRKKNMKGKHYIKNNKYIKKKLKKRPLSISRLEYTFKFHFLFCKGH